MKRSLAALFALLVWLNGCQHDQPKAAEWGVSFVRNDPRPAIGNGLITISSRGDFSIQSSDGSVEGTVKPEGIQQLEQLLEPTRSLKSRYGNPNTPAATTYSLRYKDHQIEWTEAAPDLPESLRKVTEYFERWLNRNKSTSLR